MVHKKFPVQLLRNVSVRIAVMVLFYGKLRLPLGHFMFFVLLNQQAKKKVTIVWGNTIQFNNRKIVYLYTVRKDHA